MLSRNEVKRAVIDIISRRQGIDPQKIKESSHLVNDLGLDSLDFVELMMAFEEAFNITVDDSIAERLLTVKTVIDYIMTLKPEKDHYMRVAVRLKMNQRKNKSTLINRFKTKHARLFSKMRSI